MTERFPKISTRLFLLALLGALGACSTLGPDYQPPRSPELDAWQPSLHGLGVGDTEQRRMELEFWWKLFDDPVLDRLIRIAEEHNLELRMAGLRLLQARALQRMARASLYPQSRQASADATHVNQQNHGGTGEGGKAFGNWNLGLSVGWELDFWGRFRRSIEAADATFFASQETRRAMQVLVKAQVASLYFSWRILQARIDIARKNARLQKRSQQIAEESFRAGNTSELDFQQARTQYLATLAAIPQLELARTQTLNALAVVLDRAPGDLPELRRENYRLPLVDRITVSEIPARLLLRRPDIRAAAWAIAAQSARIGIAEAELYPAITLLGSLGWSASTIRGTPETTTLGIGPTLRWNIFDQGLIRNNVRLEDARLQELIEQYHDSVLQAAMEIDNAAISVVKTAEQTKILEQTVQSAERALEIATASYREGYTDFQRVLDAQRALFTQNDRLVSIRGENLGYLIALYKSLGGGWSPAGPDDLVPASTRERMKARTDWGDLLEAPLGSLPAPFPSEPSGTQ